MSNLHDSLDDCSTVAFVQCARDPLVPILHDHGLVTASALGSFLTQHVQNLHEFLGKGAVALEGHGHEIDVVGCGSFLVFVVLGLVCSAY